MNIQGLIERYEKFKANQKKMTSVDLVLRDLRSLDEPEPLPFKLKDVVGRIKKRYRIDKMNLIYLYHVESH